VSKSNSEPKSNPRSLRLEKSQSVPTQEIRFRAYELYEKRGRGDGHALDDWLQAEAELLGNGQPPLKRKTRKG
jgi:hypothetical protein